MMDIHNNITVLRALSPVSVTDTTAQTTQVLDLAGYTAAELVILTGSLADADATFTVQVLESDDNSSYSAVADDDLLGTEALASFQYDDDNETRKIGYVGHKRYIKATITPAANSSAALIAAAWLVKPLALPAA